MQTSIDKFIIVTLCSVNVVNSTLLAWVVWNISTLENLQSKQWKSKQSKTFLSIEYEQIVLQLKRRTFAIIFI